MGKSRRRVYEETQEKMVKRVSRPCRRCVQLNVSQASSRQSEDSCSSRTRADAQQVRAVGEGDPGDGHEVVHQLLPAVLALDVEGQVISSEMQNLRSRRYQQYRASFRG